MAIINKISNTLVQGDILVKFSIKTGLFNLEFPTKMECDQRLLSSLYYNELIDNIKLIIHDHLLEKSFVKKWIVIKFQTSESSDILKEIFGSTEKLHRGSGFVIEWCVINEYYVDRKHANQIYEIVEKSPNSNYNVSNRLNVFGQLFSDKVRKLEYSETLYTFLQSFEMSISNLCNSLIKFLDEDGEQLLNNIKSNGHNLLK